MKTRIGQLLLMLLICIAINVKISKELIVTELFSFKEANPIPKEKIPKIITLNMEQLVASKLAEGMKPVEVLQYTHSVTTLLLREGYLIIDEASLVAAHPDYAMKPMTMNELKAALAAHGINVEEENTKIVDRAMKEGEAQVKKLLEPASYNAN